MCSGARARSLPRRYVGIKLAGPNLDLYGQIELVVLIALAAVHQVISDMKPRETLIDASKGGAPKCRGGKCICSRSPLARLLFR